MKLGQMVGIGMGKMFMKKGVWKTGSEIQMLFNLPKYDN